MHSGKSPLDKTHSDYSKQGNIPARTLWIKAIVDSHGQY